MLHDRPLAIIALFAACLLGADALAADKIRIAASQKGFWDNFMLEMGVEKGFFKEAGIDLDIVWTDGGSDTQQAVISGSSDIGMTTGTLGVLSAWSKGAPITVISASATGSYDAFWYVKGTSPIRAIKDLNGKSVAFSRPGSSTHQLAQEIVAANGVQAKLVSTGGLAATLTAVMSDQVDAGWGVAPTLADRVAKGEIRVLFNGNAAPGAIDQTVRVNVANSNWLEKNEALAKRFVATLQKSIDWSYDDDEAVKAWATLHKLDVDAVRKARNESYPRPMYALAPVKGLDPILKQALETKRINAAFTDQQKADFVKNVARLTAK